MDGGTQVRSLRELFASMSHGPADPAAALADGGHGELPPHLMTEAIISYADAAPLEVAEHLSPFVVGHSAVPAADADAHPPVELHDGFALLASAPDAGHLDHHLGDDHLGGDHGNGHLDVHHSLLDDMHHPMLDDGAFHPDPSVDHSPDHSLDHSGDHDAHTLDQGGQGDHADLWFGHGQAAALGPHLDAGPLTGGEEDSHHYDTLHSDGQGDPWLEVHDDGLDHGTQPFGWEPDADQHQPVHPDHAPQPDEPGGHDLTDLGHA